MKRLVIVSVLAAAFLASLIPAALAHPTREFSACAAFRRTGGLCFRDGAAYDYGRVVRLRAQLRPTHTLYRAVVMRRRPYSSVWRPFDEVSISNKGRIRWAWQTSREDAVQRRPYSFRFRIPGHGVSNIVTVWVLFGE